MVHKDLIGEVFDNVLSKHYRWKCGKGGFNKQVLATFNKFREETKDLNYEKIIFVTNKGEIVWSNDGDGNSVECDNYEAWLQSREHGLLHMEHNHPVVKGLEYFPSVLSKDDIRGLVDKAGDYYLYRSITAECPNGSRMSVSKTRDFDKRYILSNEEDMIRVSNDYNLSLIRYIELYRGKILDYTGLSREELVSTVGGTGDWGASEYKKMICKKVTDEIGTLSSHFEKEGIVEEFEEYGLVLKITGERGVYGYEEE